MPHTPPKPAFPEGALAEKLRDHDRRLANAENRAGAWIPLPYTTIFGDNGGSYQKGLYTKDQNGLVRIQGLARTIVAGPVVPYNEPGGANYIICTLPPEFRPGEHVLTSQWCSEGPIAVAVFTSGNVCVFESYAGSFGNGVFLTLQITFYAQA